MKNRIRLKHIVFILLTGFLVASCEDIWNRCVDGNGDREIESRNLTGFERIEINGDFDVQITTGEEPAAIIETDENLIDLIVTHVSGNKLIVETRNGICIRPTRPVEISISAGDIREITLNGSGLVYCYGLIAENLEVDLSGSGEIELDNVVCTAADIELEGSGLIDCDLVSEDVKTQLEGSGEIKVRGQSVSGDHKIIGSGKINASFLNSDVAVVYISGSGVVDVDVNNALDVTIIGSGKVYYTGNPNVTEYISGSGDVIER